MTNSAPIPSHGANAAPGAYLAGLDPRTRRRFEIVWAAVSKDPALEQIARFIKKEFEARREVLHFFAKDKLSIDRALFDPEIESDVDFIVLMDVRDE